MRNAQRPSGAKHNRVTTIWTPVSARSPWTPRSTTRAPSTSVEDCDAAIKRAQQAGATVQMPAEDMFWGDRYGVVRDPFGHSSSFATHISDPAPVEIAKAAEAAFAHTEVH
ncbi:MAG: VOC family protein [Thermoguttaceae bacterium]|nr:VOC family protein [Thermoguttaceae bacterium]